MIEGRYYGSLTDYSVKCLLCPQDCVIEPGKKGFCRVRKNIKGKLHTLNYGKISAMAIDPIEKKPLYHFYPGREIFSIGTYGCNFRCQFCQNWKISQQEKLPLKEVLPRECVRKAQSYEGNIGIAYTYSEPSVWFEYVLETAKLAKQEGLKNVLITNGYIRVEPLEELLPYIDAMNIDVKGFTTSFYNENIKGNLKPVIQTVEKSYKNCHIEITNLLISGLNDSKEEIENFVNWLSSIGRDIPLHFSRYYPSYKMDIPPTPEKTMLNAWDYARGHLDYVYLGNIFIKGKSNTYCPDCNSILITREGIIETKNLDKDKCQKCGRKLNLVT